MKHYIYQNILIGKKQLRQLLAWSFTNYNSIEACALSDELKYLGFKYATQAGISISIEDLKIPFVKNLMLEKATQEISNSEKIYLKGKLTDVERFQKIIDTWSLTSESLKEQVVSYFKNYDPLNSVYIMAFSGARGNLSQVRQLVGMRGLMSDPSGQIMNLTIKKNFREGLTITDYLMSGYGARKGIVDTALKTANSGYLTRRLIDVGQDILIREKDCFTKHSFLLVASNKNSQNLIYEKIIGRTLINPIIDSKTNEILVSANTQITPKLINTFQAKNISKFYVRSPLTCNLYQAICQKCYGWDSANENLVDIGEAIGILAGQSIGEPGTQLTMRTFHTGGIFTAEVRQQIVSPVDGIIKFSNFLKTVILRTNRGEDVLITKNSGSLIIVPDNKNNTISPIKILPNTILFPKNNQYLLKDMVIGELLNINKQIKTEIKPILNDHCGEIFIPKLINKNHLHDNNKLIWILYGQLYNSPINSFINFYPDYKLNSHTYIFRTKLVNHYRGNIKSVNLLQNLSRRIIKINTIKYSLRHPNLQKLTRLVRQKNCLLYLENHKYLVTIQKHYSRFYLQLNRTNQIGTSITKTFQTLTGGILFYNYRNSLEYNQLNSQISYFSRSNSITNYKSLVPHCTIIWLGEEIHRVNCESNMLLVEHGDFISEGFELIPNIFSKTSGIVKIRQKANLVQTISIKCGIVYEGKKVKGTSKKLYYPGELLVSTIEIKNLSFCEYIGGKKLDQLLVRNIELYEFSKLTLDQAHLLNNSNKILDLKLQSKATYCYKSNQIIKGSKNLILISKVLTFKPSQFLNQNTKIEMVLNQKYDSLDLKVSEKITLNKYIVPKLRYKNLLSCFLLQADQFVDQYTLLGYIETISSKSLEIVKLKVKTKGVKQILLISNKDCFIVERNNFPKKKINEFIIGSSNINEIGKIIIVNDKFLTLQKGRPYFFPNCKNEKTLSKSSLQYKIIPPNRIKSSFQTNKLVFLNYYDLTVVSLNRLKPLQKLDQFLEPKVTIKINFSKFFIKKNGKFYSSLIPQLFKKFSICKTINNLRCEKIIRPKSSYSFFYERMDRTLLIQSSELVENPFRLTSNLDHQLVLVKFLESPLTRITKSIGLYAITEDYFEQDGNSVFCKNSKFIEEGETIGLLKLEKEITDDIVQGLPRIEEILEARKKNLDVKRIPTSKKKGLLIQKTSLDPNFEFRSLGNSIQENEKINPHKLLKVYFNYYGLVKFFTCDRTSKIKSSRLLQNYEGSYKSFKKVQSFILNSVQSVYQSQGVLINDKHLEIIIKQMTTKVLITYEGHTPLLRREVIDLYHIKYINKVVYEKNKSPASYVPLLLGITKAALNNPSFISAASFQETTRVLTKAAIEGRIDWLRGLKENIIIGHLIPSGTGSQSYRNCFNNPTKFDSFLIN